MGEGTALILEGGSTPTLNTGRGTFQVNKEAPGHLKPESPRGTHEKLLWECIDLNAFPVYEAWVEGLLDLVDDA